MLLLMFVESAEVCVCLHALPCSLINFHLKLIFIHDLWRWRVGILSALVIETLLWQESQSFRLPLNNGFSGTSSPEALGKLTLVESFGLSFVEKTVFLLIHVDQLQSNVSMYSQKSWYQGSPPPALWEHPQSCWRLKLQVTPPFLVENLTFLFFTQFCN